MASRRAQKAAEAIRGVVGTSILHELKDPRVQLVTVTYVEVSDDLRHAKVHVSVMGSETQQRLCLHGLQSAAGFLQSRIAERIDMRYTPRITFLLDQGVKRSIEIASILRDVLPPESQADAEAETEADAEEDDVLSAEDDASPEDDGNALDHPDTTGGAPVSPADQ